MNYATANYSVNADKWNSVLDVPENGKLFTGKVRDRFGEFPFGPLKYNADGILVKVLKDGRESQLAEDIELIGWKHYAP